MLQVLFIHFRPMCICALEPLKYPHLWPLMGLLSPSPAGQAVDIPYMQTHTITIHTHNVCYVTFNFITIRLWIMSHQ